MVHRIRIRRQGPYNRDRWGCPLRMALRHRQDSAPPSNSAQAAPVDATSTAVTAPNTTAATELAPQPVTASEKSHKAAPSQNRTGAAEVGTTPLRGASIRITAAGPATAAIMHQAGDLSRGPVSEFGTTVQPLSRRQTIATFEMGRSSPRIDWSTNSEKSACRSGAGHT